MAKPNSDTNPPSAGDQHCIQRVKRHLSLLPTRCSAQTIFDAIAACAPAAAGIYGTITPAMPSAITSHGIRLPPAVFDSWISTRKDHLEMVLAPLVHAKEGELWLDTETVTGPLRNELEVLQLFDAYGLGEGAGYKVFSRLSPCGPEHVMLALIKERGERFSRRDRKMLAALNPSIQTAFLKMGLPIIPSQSILAQIVADDAVGYICLSRTGSILEANRRAYELARKYKQHDNPSPRRTLLLDFAVQAIAMTRQVRQVRLYYDGGAWLAITKYDLAKESHAISEDIFLLQLKEELGVTPSFHPKALPLLSTLTPRQREIATRLLDTGDSYKEIAADRSISEGTMRKHAENIYRKLGVRSRAELVQRLRRQVSSR